MAPERRLGAADTLDFARLAVTLRRTRAGHLERLRESVDPRVPLLYVPYLFVRSHGLRSTRQIGHVVVLDTGEVPRQPADRVGLRVRSKDELFQAQPVKRLTHFLVDPPEGVD